MSHLLSSIRVTGLFGVSAAFTASGVGVYGRLVCGASLRTGPPSKWSWFEVPRNGMCSQARDLLIDNHHPLAGGRIRCSHGSSKP